MTKGGKFVVCSFLKKKGNVVKADNFEWKIHKKVSCRDSNIIYLIECDKERFQKHYIGFTTKEFRERICQHIGYARNKVLTKANGYHTNLPGYDNSNMKFAILEKVRSTDPLYGREREKLHIRKSSTHFMKESTGSHDK